MAQGLQVWDENGNLVVDPSSRLSNFLGAIEVTGSGTYTDSRFASGEPFGIPVFGGVTNVYAKIEFSGTTMTYTLSDYFGANPTYEILFGVY